MYLHCPNPGCGADVELEAETVDNGDGPWAMSGTACSVVGATVDTHAPCCEGGCFLTTAQVEVLEARAAEEYAMGPTEPF
jgi:hypothetical protein